jgi:hypothetical protein
MSTDSLNFTGTDFFITQDDLDPDFFEHLCACGEPGDATETVAAIRSLYEIKGRPGDCRDYLSQFGAWEHDELQDHDKNLDRLVWIVGCDLAEDNQAHLSTY